MTGTDIESSVTNWSYPLTMVPDWCDLPKENHQDGLGGCWGIARGWTSREYCQGCEYYRPEWAGLWEDFGGEA